ncbi:hypothetical protein ACIBCN_27780 [Nocardia sp. NPDC051052]|uniref:hypothetical protein n=1 Tax=Nocardia sp. NPDC051052 TaxID=3364322 RepID=UPI00378B4CAF
MEFGKDSGTGENSGVREGAAEQNSPETVAGGSYDGRQLGSDSGYESYPTRQGYAPEQQGGYEPYSAVPQGGYPPYPGPPQGGYPPNPYGGNAYGQFQPPMTKMPGSVRAAQVVSIIFATLGIVLIVVALGLGRPELAGGLMFGFLFAIIMAGFTLTFGYAENGTRTTVIVLASIEGLVGLGGMGAQQPPGLLGCIVGLTVVITLSRASASAWFKRPRGYAEV